MSILNHSPTSTTRSSTSPLNTNSLSQPLFSNLSSSNAHLEAATNVSVASAATVTEAPFRSLIAQKERELHDINEYRLKSMEEAVRTREASEKAIRIKFKKLKDDFVFNLRLIEERDRELDKYETTCDKLKTYVREREKDIANMKIELTEERSKRTRSEEDSSRQEIDFQHQLKTQASQSEAYRWESQQQMQDYESRLHTLTARMEETLREHTSAMESQSQSLQAEARRIAETAESRYQAKEVTHDRQKKDLERRVHELQQELTAANEKNSAILHDADALRELVTGNEAKTKKLEWELSDITLTKDREINNLIKEKNDLKTMKQTLLDEYESKMSELLQSLHAVEGAFVQQREQYELQLRQEASTREEELRRMSQRLSEQLRSAEESLKTSDRSRNELKKQMSDTQSRDHEQLVAARREAESYKLQVASMSTKSNDAIRETTGKIWSLEMECKETKERCDEARDECERVKAELRMAQDEVERSSQREGDLKREHANQSSSWQTRWERERTDMQARHDQMVGVLQSQRDHVETESRVLETRCTELENEKNKIHNEMNDMKKELRIQQTLVETLKLDSQREKANAAANAIRGVTRVNNNNNNGINQSTRSSIDSLDNFDEDDLGPMASPLRPLRTFDEEDSNTSNTSNTNGAAQALEIENQKLKAAVSIMAREMENIQQRREEEKMYSDGLRSNGSTPRHGIVPETPPYNDVVPPSPEISMRLDEAETNVKLLMMEREKLMEVSNGLRADLNHALSSSVEERNMEKVVLKIKKETSKKYESKMHTIENKLKELMLHNNALTSELSKWTLDQTSNEHEYDLDTLGRGEQQEDRSTRSIRSGRSGRGSSEASSRDRMDLEKRRVQDSIDIDLLKSFDDGSTTYEEEEEEDHNAMDQMDAMDHVNEMENEGDALFYGRPSNQRNVIDPPTDSSSSEEDSGVSGGNESRLKSRLRARLQGVDHTSKKSSSSSSLQMAETKTTTTTTSARERLKKVRESLELVASKPIMHQRPIEKMNRSTMSQQRHSSKLKEKQSKRKGKKNRFTGPKKSGVVEI